MSAEPTLIHEPSEFQRRCDEVREAGFRIGVVPTMGALHEGHLSLIHEVRRRGAEFVVVTVFVNPLQFGESEDLDRYPRTLTADLQACGAKGVQLVFAPTSEAMYPPDFQTSVQVRGITDRWEGASRPGHFAGVTTVVAKLFHLVGPAIAGFGRKDYQQWRVLERMTRDLRFPIEIVCGPIIRELDGLARSSRNRYLTPEQRSRALAIAQGLRAAHAAWSKGERQAEVLRSIAVEPVVADFDRVDYVAVVDPNDLEPLEGRVEHAVILVAAHLGSTRLIDNLELTQS